MLSAVGVVVAQPLLDAIGSGWLFTILFILSLASSTIIWAMTYYGPRWRASMDKQMQRRGL